MYKKSRQNDFPKRPMTYGKYKKENGYKDSFIVYVEKKSNNSIKESTRNDYNKFNEKNYWKEYYPKSTQKIEEQETFDYNILDNKKKETFTASNLINDDKKPNVLNILSQNECEASHNKLKEDLGSLNLESLNKIDKCLKDEIMKENFCKKSKFFSKSFQNFIV